MEIDNEKLVDMIRQGGMFRQMHIERLYNQNKGLVIKVIKQCGGADNLEDLLQESYITLCDCVQQYDPQQGFMFITYYLHAVKNMCGRYGYKTQNVKLSYWMISKIHNYNKAVNMGLTDEQIMLQLNITAAQLDEIRVAKYIKSTVSIDSPIKNSEDDDLIIADTIPDSSAAFEDDVIAKVDGIRLWRICKRHLSKREYKIIYLHYKQDIPYTKIAKNLNISFSAVSSISQNALYKLKKRKEIQAYSDCVYRHTTLNEFKHTHTSSVERAVIYRSQFGGGLIDDIFKRGVRF